MKSFRSGDKYGANYFCRVMFVATKIVLLFARGRMFMGSKWIVNFYNASGRNAFQTNFSFYYFIFINYSPTSVFQKKVVEINVLQDHKEIIQTNCYSSKCSSK